MRELNLEELIASYDDSAPLEKAWTIPAGWYTDPGILDLEHETVFSRSWIAVGRTDQVATAGSYFTTELAGEPLLLVRDADGTLRAFYNVCRHHAAAVVTCAQGSAQIFRCPYHGWSYGLDGSLKGTPDFHGVCDFDRSRNGLVPVRVAEMEQFVFVCLSSEGPELRESFAGLQQRLAPLGLDSLRFYERREYTLDCNWKVFVDNYLDGGYHVPYIHKGLNSVLDYSDYTIENGTNYSLQSSPIVTTGGNATVSTTRTGDRAIYIWIYPNFMINVYSGVMDTNLVFPMGTDRCRVIFDFYFTGGEERHAFHQESIAVSDAVQQEDVGICESVQRGLRSKAYRAGRLSVRRESGEHLFHRLVARDLKAGTNQGRP